MVGPVALRRDSLLGSTLLLWIGAGLLSLYLLCNPGAAVLKEHLGTVRPWGAVLGLASLGLALSGQRPLLWLLPLFTLPLLLPAQVSRRVWPVTLAGNVALALLGLRRRKRKQGFAGVKRRVQSWRRPPRRSAYCPGKDRRAFRLGRRAVARRRYNTKGGDLTRRR